MIIEEKLLHIKCKVKYCGNAIINIIACCLRFSDKKCEGVIPL